LAAGDLGTSLTNRVTVVSMIVRTLPVTASLLLFTLGISLVVAVPVGLAAALRSKGWIGRIFRVGTSILIAVPVFYSGLILLYVFSINLRVLPVGGYDGSFPNVLTYLLLPALTGSWLLAPILARVLQSSIAATMEEEFVETAIARGLPQKVVMWRYLLRPSLGPTIAVTGYLFAQLLGTAVVLELVFNLPGLGTALLNAVIDRDYPVVQGLVLFLGVSVVIISHLAEFISGLVDPRTVAK
jgi:peptide/nickel transport system permease protein